MYHACMASKRKKLSDQIREAIDGCGMTRYAISKQTGIGQDMLSLFMAGKRGFSIQTLDLLADFLNLNIIAGKPRPSKDR